MIDPDGCHLVVWEARHDNGWITLVIEQPDGTFVAWAGLGEAIGVDYVEDTPEQAQAAAMFALKRRAGTGSARVHVRRSRCGRTRLPMKPHLAVPDVATLDAAGSASSSVCAPTNGRSQSLF